MTKAAWLVLAAAAVCGPVAMAQDITGLVQMEQNLAADQSVMAARLQAEQATLQAKLAAQQGVLTARLAAQQGVMAARLAEVDTVAARLAVQQGVMVARLAEVDTSRARATTDQIVMMARLEPLELKALGVEMQTGGSVVRIGQVKDTLFAGAEKFGQGASEVTEINLDPTTMSMIGHGVFASGKGNELSSKLNFMVIHSYKYDKPDMYNMSDFEAYAKKLTDGSWNCSIHVRSKNESTDICSRAAGESNEMVILTAEPREITLIHMSGKMSLNDLVRMSGEQHSVRLPQEPMTFTPEMILVKPPLQPAVPKKSAPPVQPRSGDPSPEPPSPPQ